MFFFCSLGDRLGLLHDWSFLKTESGFISIAPGTWLRLNKAPAKVLRGGSGWGAATHTALLFCFVDHLTGQSRLTLNFSPFCFLPLEGRGCRCAWPCLALAAFLRNLLLPLDDIRVL